MMVDFGEVQILERQVLHPLDGALRRQGPQANQLQQITKLAFFHRRRSTVSITFFGRQHPDPRSVCSVDIEMYGCETDAPRENMLRAQQAGAVIMPCIPVFYDQSRTIDDLVTQAVCGVLSQVGLSQGKMYRWTARPESSREAKA